MYVEPYELDNREEWLRNACEAIAIRMQGVEAFNQKRVDAARTCLVSVGIPKAGGGAKHPIGQCWPTVSSGNSQNHVFISPELYEEVEILTTLAHELCHVVNDCRDGHKGPFKKMIKALGLAGKATATTIGPECERYFKELAYCLGPFPHGRLNMMDRKKQGTRLVKIVCEGCGFVARTTRKWIVEQPMPIHCEKEMTVGGDDE